MKVNDLKMLTDFAPAQFEGRTEDGRPVYIRYRNGWLSVEVGKPNGWYECFTVYEAEVESDHSSDNSITLEEVTTVLTTIDLDERLQELERQESDFKERWKALCSHADEVDVEGIRVSKLVIPNPPPWVTPYENAVGRPDFETAFASFTGADVIVYFHTNEKGTPSISCAVRERFQYLEPLRLVEVGSKAFGGPIFGVTGGAGRGEVDCVSNGKHEEAFDDILNEIRSICEKRI